MEKKETTINKESLGQCAVEEEEGLCLDSFVCKELYVLQEP